MLTSTRKTADRGPVHAIEVIEPAALSTPVIFASPHSGRDYSPEFLRLTRLDKNALRQSEDSYVDLLFDDATHFGAPMLRALFPRAYVDVNRARNELDPRMFADALPRSADTRSSRVIAGLGVIPRIVADGHDIYARKLYYIDAKRRLAACYDPYHAALSRLIDRAVERFGVAVVIDCHSMPSAGGAPVRKDDPPIDFVLGDRFGSSCAPYLTHRVEEMLLDAGYEVARNAPYAGGFVAASYGRPRSNVHVLQIEISRALYLDERRIARTRRFDALKSSIKDLIGGVTNMNFGDLHVLPQAAE